MIYSNIIVTVNLYSAKSSEAHLGPWEQPGQSVEQPGHSVDQPGHPMQQSKEIYCQGQTRLRHMPLK